MWLKTSKFDDVQAEIESAALLKVEIPEIKAYQPKTHKRTQVFRFWQFMTSKQTKLHL